MVLCLSASPYGEQAATETDGFIDWLSENMEPSTVKERLGSLKASWDWGTEADLVTEKTLGLILKFE